MSSLSLQMVPSQCSRGGAGLFSSRVIRQPTAQVKSAGHHTRVHSSRQQTHTSFTPSEFTSRRRSRLPFSSSQTLRTALEHPSRSGNLRPFSVKAVDGSSSTTAEPAAGAASAPDPSPPPSTSPEPASGTDRKSGAVRAFRRRTRIADVVSGDGAPGDDKSWVGATVTLTGWVRTVRNQKTFSFIELNDGSSLTGIQLVAVAGCDGYEEIESGRLTTGAAVTVTGEVAESQGKGQKLEIKVLQLTLVGESDGTTYPLQKKRHSLEYLRSIAHLRPRTNTIGAVSRIRSTLAHATHRFFQENGFLWVATPIITASDCEGAGDQFCVTTLVPESAADASASRSSRVPSTKEGTLDWSRDFFKKPAFLTVSGQLNAEIYASALHDVYTFGPTFRAENSNTSRHLAEFWMVEPELAFADLQEDMACASAFLKYLLRDVLERCADDYKFLEKFVEPGITERLTHVLEQDFHHVTYTEAVDLLLKSKQSFEFPVEWGIDLQSEHERFLTETIFKGQPLIVTDYPKDIKAFYMRLNDDGRTVAAMDVLVPRVGELIGGSQREERLPVLEQRMDELNLNKEAYWWYLDLRRYGSVPHAGFGVGFERLVQFVTGVENIRDAIPFPRVPGSAEF